MAADAGGRTPGAPTGTLLVRLDRWCIVVDANSAGFVRVWMRGVDGG